VFEEDDQSFRWTCDNCGLVAVFPNHEFYRSLGEIKARNWKITWMEDGWRHLCSKCRKSKSVNVTEFLNRKSKSA
jgi:hypothetical protein